MSRTDRNMSSKRKKGRTDEGQYAGRTKMKKRKRKQLVLTPKVLVQPVLSDASTIPYIVSGDVSNSEPEDNSMYDFTLGDLEQAGGVESDHSTDSLLGEPGDQFNQRAPLREDMEIVRERWTEGEVGALMDGINVNRAAIKFNFDGPGGGKEIKRQGWKDVARYVNSSCDTHRTIKQCRDKTDDYTGRVKKKFSRLRYEIGKTGNGAIKDGLKIKDNEGKALDYLREEAVRGIPGVEPLEIGVWKTPPSEENLALLWKVDRDNKPDYAAIKMEREGVPKNYKDKVNRRLARRHKEKRKLEHEKEMKLERKAERAQAREARRLIRKQKKQRKREEKDMLDNIAKNKECRRIEREAGLEIVQEKKKKGLRKVEGKDKVHRNKVEEERELQRILRKEKKRKSNKLKK